MTPYERTLSVLTSLDLMLTAFDSGDHELDKRISFSLKWIHSNIAIETVYQMLDTESFENRDVILDLLDEPAFNVMKGN
jgi:hypothetical protein